MASNKGKTEGGSGGKRGHSNVNHWAYTDEVKLNARVQRRIEDKAESEQGADEYVSNSRGDLEDTAEGQ
ncbi:MAG: hypothetical protein AAF662_07860 [Pseudomonadota bacterium]